MVTRFELSEPWMGAGNWFSEDARLEDGIAFTVSKGQPFVLEPHAPQVATLVVATTCSLRDPRGQWIEHLDEAMMGLRGERLVSVSVVYATSARTVKQTRVLRLNHEAHAQALEGAAQAWRESPRRR